MPKLTGLARRQGRYYYRRRVPLDIVEALGKREVKIALGTSDLREANRPQRGQVGAPSRYHSALLVFTSRRRSERKATAREHQVPRPLDGRGTVLVHTSRLWSQKVLASQ